MIGVGSLLAGDRSLGIATKVASHNLHRSGLGHQLNDADDGQEQRDHDDSNHARHKDDHHRFDQARQTGHGLIDLVVLSLDSAYILEIIRGVEEALEPTGLRLVISATNGEDQRERQWLAKISDGWTDGAILLLAQGQSARVQSLRRRRTPFVVVDHQGELGPHVPSVGATNWAGARSATEYLLSLGHRRIGFIGGSPPLGCAQERASGYQAALKAEGIEPDPDLVRRPACRPLALLHLR